MTNLRDVCYKQIKDNFYYGLFGDFKIIVEYKTGYFNATKLCNAGGKKFYNWIRNKQAADLVEFYRPSSDLKGVPPVMEINEKGDEIYNKVINGTYVSSKLICSIAIWISHEFYDKVNTIVHSYYINQFKEKFQSDYKELEIRLSLVEKMMNNIKANNIKYENDVVPKTFKPSKLNMFFIIQKNDHSSKYPYYVIRCQKAIYKRRLASLREKYPKLEIVYKLNYNPNVINLFNRMKENISYIETKFNHLNFSDMSQLQKDIQLLIPKLEM